MKRKYDRIKTNYRFHQKGEHEKYIGHTFTYVMDYVEDGEIKTDVIVLTEKDLFINALKKAEYFQNLNA